MNQTFEYVFPSIKGIQAGNEYYVAMCPMGLIPKIFIFNENELRPELRSQRVLNDNRIPELTRYLLDNDNYVFSALTASIDKEVRFDQIDKSISTMGFLHIPMTTQFIINDGQHRRAAIESALNEKPELADETIAVVFFLDQGLERCQQMFTDLNKHAIRTSRSLNVLYDHRDELSSITRDVVFNSDVFKNLVEMEKNNLSPRSRKLFTLSSIYSAHKALFKDLALKPNDKIDKAIEFWSVIGASLPDWNAVASGEVASSHIRSEYLHSHGIVLHALGVIGNELIKSNESFSVFNDLNNIDWSRQNTKIWEGRAMIGGRVQKSSNHILLTAAYIKECLGLQKTENERVIENKVLIANRS
jgi:DNA sulfur modification protein DndB